MSSPKKKRSNVLACVIKRILICLFSVFDTALIAAMCVVYVLECGPSQKARDLFVISMNETSAAKFVSTIFLDKATVDEILASNTFEDTDIVTDAELVVIAAENTAQKDEGIDPDGDGIDIVPFSGSTFKGRMMIVYDPSRVFLGTSGAYGPGIWGRTLPDICDSYDNIVGAINGGGWIDSNGHGMGGEPLGFVISEGKALWGGSYTAWDMAGMTVDNKLVVGRMTAQSAIDNGVRDAAIYGPSLIINGEPLEALGTGSGLNPRTAIGQRADGAMLLMTIDGRQSNSLGASLTDVRDIMLEFGAVNAYNLDGGSSSSMIYNGETINQSSSLVGLREMPTAWLVRGQ
ncbi:MAG: phosphodiester glycosidase family protein [Oscillospiraceae bacterium]